MAMHITQLEEVKSRLNTVTSLFDDYQRKNYNFIRNAITWTKQVETLLKDFGVPAASQIAGLRGELLALERGILPNNASSAGAANKRKVREAAAARVLSSIIDTIQTAIAPRVQQFEEAELLARQIASVARVKDLIHGEMNHLSHHDKLMLVKQRIMADNDLISAYIQLEGQVGLFDALALLDIAFPELK